MTAPLVAKQTNYLKNNVPYYKYYQTTDVPDDTAILFSSATATIGGQNTYSPAYSFKGAGTNSGNFPSSGSGMTTSIVTPSTYNNTDVTLSAWIKPSQNNESSRTIWGCHADSTQSGISFGMDDAYPGKLKFHPKGYGNGCLRSNTTLYANTWYFVVCVYDRTNMQMRIYIDGQLDASQNLSASVSDMNLIFGYYIWKAGFWSPSGASSKTASQTASQNFLGNIINCCTWYRALSQSEITTLYNGGSGLRIDTSVAPYTDVKIAYPMNETSGTVAYSAISGQDTGLYGSNTTQNQHVEDSIFAGQGVVPRYLYVSGDNWETNMPVSSSAEFVSDVLITRGIIPTKVTLTFNNSNPRNPQNLTIQGSTNGSTWTTLTTVTVPSNTNRVVEQAITSSTEYTRFRSKTTSAYTNTGLTINNIKIDGYYEVISEVGEHDNWDTRTQEGTHTVCGTSSDYDSIEYQNKEYEVQNV